jgi:hypothetical protein
MRRYQSRGYHLRHLRHLRLRYYLVQWWMMTYLLL